MRLLSFQSWLEYFVCIIVNLLFVLLLEKSQLKAIFLSSLILFYLLALLPTQCRGRRCKFNARTLSFPHSCLILTAHVVFHQPRLLTCSPYLFSCLRPLFNSFPCIQDCLRVLKKVCGKYKIPDPIDYVVTRWSQEPFSKMSFSYIP